MLPNGFVEMNERDLIAINGGFNLFVAITVAKMAYEAGKAIREYIDKNAWKNFQKFHPKLRANCTSTFPVREGTSI